jgi:ubiquitin carboxyl-terminal hydrolase 36/42
MSSAQKTLLPQNDIATFSAKSKQIASSSHKEISSSGQSALGADGALIKLGNGTSVASSMVNSPARLSETDKQTSHSQTTMLCKTSSNINNTDMSKGFSAQTGPIKDAIISNEVIPSTTAGIPAYSEKMKDLTESLKQDDKTVKELPVSKKSIVPGLEIVDAGKQNCSEASMKMVTSDSCNGIMAKRVDLKSKKIVRYPVMNLWLGPRQLLLGSLKLQKKRKHKSKRQSLVCKNMANVDSLVDNTNEQQASTSANVLPETVECSPRKRKRSYASVTSESNTQSFEDRQQVVGASGAGTGGDHNMDSTNGKSATFAIAEHPKFGSTSSANKVHSRNNIDAKMGVSQHVGIFTKDLKAEVTVPCWDDVVVPTTEIRELKHSQSKSIGYLLDEWDEEYDRGKTKKVRKAKEDDYDELNPFQEEANYVSHRKAKQKAYQARPLNKPVRAHH